jgi:hypothetical protein
MLIALNQILSSGGTQRVLVNAKAINYMVDKENGYGSIVYTFIGTIRVTETPQQINQIVSLTTHKTKAI